MSALQALKALNDPVFDTFIYDDQICEASRYWVAKHHSGVIRAISGAYPVAPKPYAVRNLEKFGECLVFNDGSLCFPSKPEIARHAWEYAFIFRHDLSQEEKDFLCGGWTYY